MDSDLSPVEPRASSSVMVVRDAQHGIEVLMTERPSTMGFAAGALVFPGGKVDPLDDDDLLKSLSTSVTNDFSFRMAVIRELCEETSLLLADDLGDCAEALATFMSCDCFLRFSELVKPTFHPEDLLYFSRWITPRPMPKRFDTRFYLARAPQGQKVVADPREIVKAEWMLASDVLLSEQSGDTTLMFPTRMNLTSLSRFECVDDAFSKMATEPVVTVEPEVVERGGQIYLKIPPVEGYGLTEIAREDIGEFMRQHGAAN